MHTRVTRSFSFEAAHQLPWHPGKCRRLHGHNYRLEVTVQGPVGENGVVMDFDDLSAVDLTSMRWLRSRVRAARLKAGSSSGRMWSSASRR